MNYSIYYGGHEFRFTFNYINTVGDLQTVILQALNIQKNKLLFLIYQDKILGRDFLFTDNLAQKELFDINLFVVVDPYQVEPGTKEAYDTWLNQQIADSDLITLNRQLLYSNTNNQANSTNLNFFTRTDSSLQQELNNINLDRPRRRHRQVFSNPNQPASGNGVDFYRNRNRTYNRTNNRTDSRTINRTNSQTSNRTNSQTSNRTNSQATHIGSNGSNDPLQMLQSFMGNEGVSGGGLSNIFSEMMGNSIYDLSVTMTQGPNGNSIGVVAGGAVGGGSNSDFFRRLMSDLEPVPVTLSRENINQLPVFKFSQLPEQIKDSNNCSICLEDFGDDDQIRVLLCKHYFHTECIDRWLSEENVRCPLCRHDSRDTEEVQTEVQTDVPQVQTVPTVVNNEDDEEEKKNRKKKSSERRKKKLKSREDNHNE